MPGPVGWKGGKAGRIFKGRSNTNRIVIKRPSCLPVRCEERRRRDQSRGCHQKSPTLSSLPPSPPGLTPSKMEIPQALSLYSLEARKKILFYFFFLLERLAE